MECSRAKIAHKRIAATSDSRTFEISAGKLAKFVILGTSALMEALFPVWWICIPCSRSRSAKGEMSESAAPEKAVVLPSRKKRQSLHGYVHEHMEAFECALSSGVPYQTLIEAALAAGFVKVAPRSIETAVYRARRKRPTRKAHSAPQPIVPASRTATPREMYSRPPLDTDVTAAIGRRFRQLVRPPRPGTDERDLLI